MVIGEKEKFAIEIKILDHYDRWVVGNFLFWIDGLMVGDPEDTSVDLKGCINWLEDFVEKPRDRYEPGLYEMDKDRAYLLLCSSVLPGNQDARFVEEKYENIFSRFHITHLGMSSFDRFSVLLVENENGEQRCIWQSGQDIVNDAYLPTDAMKTATNQAIKYFKDQIKRI